MKACVQVWCECDGVDGCGCSERSKGPVPVPMRLSVAVMGGATTRWVVDESAVRTELMRINWAPYGSERDMVCPACAKEWKVRTL